MPSVFKNKTESKSMTGEWKANNKIIREVVKK